MTYIPLSSAGKEDFDSEKKDEVFTAEENHEKLSAEENPEEFGLWGALKKVDVKEEWWIS